MLPAARSVKTSPLSVTSDGRERSTISTWYETAVAWPGYWPRVAPILTRLDGNLRCLVRNSVDVVIRVSVCWPLVYPSPVPASS